MFLSFDTEHGLSHSGFVQRTLVDGRDCLAWASGYFFDAGGRMRIDDEIVDWLASRVGPIASPNLLSGMNGCFSLAIIWPDTGVAEVACDRFGSVSVYYYIDEHEFTISDDFWKVAARLPRAEYDADAAFGMVFLGYAGGCRTLLSDVKELPQAALHRFAVGDGRPGLTSQPYWVYTSHSGPLRSREGWKDALAQVLDAVFARHARAVKDRNWSIEVPLSGGLDSRLVIGMARRYQVPLQAFSYGPPGNAESACASQLAVALCVPYRFVPIDDPGCLEPPLVLAMTGRIGMKARFTVGLGGQLSSTGYSPSTVYVSGHPGNLPAGVFERGLKLVRTRQQMIQHLVNNMAHPLFDETAAALFPRTWDATLWTRVASDGWRFDPDDPVGSYERWHLQFHIRRLLLSEMRTYEQFGRWMLPFLDHELFDVYTGMPFKFRFRRCLHVDTLLHKVFVDDLAALARVPLANTGIPRVPQLQWRDRVVMWVPRSAVGDWILRRGTAAKHREHLASVGTAAASPAGPDPFDFWWLRYPSFRQSVVGMLRDWDGLHGIVNVEALLPILQKPMPCYFVRLALPALLTLCFFQKLAESGFASPALVRGNPA